MLVIGERILEFLTADTDITNALGGAFIFSSAVEATIDGDEVPIRIEIDFSAGLDEDSIPVDSDSFFITIIVNRSVLDASIKCYDLAKLVDSKLNRQELEISNSTYIIHSITRKGSSGLRIDDDTQDFWYSLTYSYLMENDSSDT